MTMTEVQDLTSLRVGEEVTACYAPNQIDGSPDLRVRVLEVGSDYADVEALESGGPGEYDTKVGQVWSIVTVEIGRVVRVYR